jgi:hypothetical protein
MRNTSQKPIVGKLKALAETGYPEASLLLDDTGGLIDCEIDTIKEKEYPHPMLDIYRRKCMEFWGVEDRVFTPYESRKFVVDSPEVLAAFEDTDTKPPCFPLLGARKTYSLDFTRLKIGILTAGGTAPGLNTVIDSIVKRHFLLATKASEAVSSNTASNLTIKGYMGGYSGLIEGNARDLDVRTTDSTSGTAGSILPI